MVTTNTGTTGHAPVSPRRMRDDFLAEATPEHKLALIRKEQAGGKLVESASSGEWPPWG